MAADNKACRDASLRAVDVFLNTPSKGANFEALRQTALEFERQGDLERSRSWWQRLAESAQAPQVMRKEAAGHAAGKLEVLAKLPTQATPTHGGEKHEGAGEHVVKTQQPHTTY